MTGRKAVIILLLLACGGCSGGPSEESWARWRKACADNEGTRIDKTAQQVDGVYYRGVSIAKNYDTDVETYRGEYPLESTISELAAVYEYVDVNLSSKKANGVGLFRFATHKAGSSECQEAPATYSPCALHKPGYCCSQTRLNKSDAKYMVEDTNITYHANGGGYYVTIRNIVDRSDGALMATGEASSLKWTSHWSYFQESHSRECGKLVDVASVLKVSAPAR